MTASMESLVATEPCSEAAPTDSSSTSQSASYASTPPSTVADAVSVASDILKAEIIQTTSPCFESSIPSSNAAEPSVKLDETALAVLDTISLQTQPALETTHIRRARPSRSSIGAPVYSLAKLTSKSIHGKRSAQGDEVRESKKLRQNDLSLGGSMPTGLDESGAANASDRLSRRGAASRVAGIDRKLAQTDASSRRISTRSTVVASEVTTTLAKIAKRGRAGKDKLSRLSREVRRLQDTNEFNGVDDRPVVHSVWSNGHYVDPNDLDQIEQQPRAKTSPHKRNESDNNAVVIATDRAHEPNNSTTSAKKGRRVKKYLEKGLYAGQDMPSDFTKGLTPAQKRTLTDFPELIPDKIVNKTMPSPIFAGLRLLLDGRDFKLPYDVCNPIAPGGPKPDWRKMTKNRFVGDAAMYWRRTDHFKDYQSRCICKPEDGCAEDCQNRIMLYECDDTNCNVGRNRCQNRAFQELQERTKANNAFHVGVDVMKTADRGFGVRSNRSFEANQIIMEYTGEIITEEECDRRMNEMYKDNECYYLMAFDQTMVIDATKGSMARFVNHSCTPTCRMEKWIVGGQPRMALFANDKPITTGDELTYDYNFNPSSDKSVQICLCGSENCRGILGPKTSADKVTKVVATVQDRKVTTSKLGKRKLQESEGEHGSDADRWSKKQKMGHIKSSLSSGQNKAKKALASLAKRTESLARKAPTIKSIQKATSMATIKTYIKDGKEFMLAGSVLSKKSRKIIDPYAPEHITEVSSKKAEAPVKALKPASKSSKTIVRRTTVTKKVKAAAGAAKVFTKKTSMGIKGVKHIKRTKKVVTTSSPAPKKRGRPLGSKNKAYIAPAIVNSPKSPRKRRHTAKASESIKHAASRTEAKTPDPVDEPRTPRKKTQSVRARESIEALQALSASKSPRKALDLSRSASKSR